VPGLPTESRVEGGPGTAAPGVDLTAYRISELTVREHEILKLLARGLSDCQIAGQRIIGDATVKTHVAASEQTVAPGSQRGSQQPPPPGDARPL